MNGTALKRARFGKGMTLRDVEKECARRGVLVDAANLARAERNLPGGIGPRKIPVLAEVLGVSIEELVPGERAA